MKFLFDFFPILLFFVAYKIYGIFVATAVAIVASFVQLAWYWLQHRRFENMHLISFGLIAVFGGATLVLQDETFIKWKPTVLFWLFAVVYFGSQYIGKKPIIQRMLEANMSLPAAIWKRLNMAWSVFFVALGFINLYVAFNYSTDTWVNFKMFGSTLMILAFIFGQAMYIGRYAKDPVTENQENP
jgi:intracellular septation protein